MSNQQGGGELVRALDWKGAFWVAAGVPPLVLFSIGGIAGTTGKLAFLVWMISMIMGFLQSFTYAEIAGMFGNKSGGASVYGATAWLRYSKFIAPLSVWCNWFAWSPVLSLGCAIAAGYILNALFPIPLADSQMVLDWVAPEHRQPHSRMTPAWSNGLLPMPARRRQKRISALLTADGVAALTPAIRGWEAYALDDPWPRQAALQLHLRDRRHPDADHLLRSSIAALPPRPAPRSGWPSSCWCRCCWSAWCRSSTVPSTGRTSPVWCRPRRPTRALTATWSLGGWTLFLGGLYIAAWSTYGFETAVCYTRELQEPEDRHVQGHLLLGPPVHRLLLPDPLLLPGRAGARRACSRRGSSMAPA